MVDEGAKNHQVPRLDPEVYRALLQTLASVLELRTAGKVVRSTPVKYNRDSSKETPYRHSSFFWPYSHIPSSYQNQGIYPLA